MASFSSGTEGLDYQAKWCERCVNYRDKGDGRGQGCAVFDAHLFFNGDQHKNPGVKAVLETLIPTVDNLWPGECAMFLAAQHG